MNPEHAPSTAPAAQKSGSESEACRSGSSTVVGRVNSGPPVGVFEQRGLQPVEGRDVLVAVAAGDLAARGRLRVAVALATSSRAPEACIINTGFKP